MDKETRKLIEADDERRQEYHIERGTLKGWRVGDFCRIKGVDQSDIAEMWWGCFTITGCFSEGRLDAVNNAGLNGNFWPSELENLTTRSVAELDMDDEA